MPQTERLYWIDAEIRAGRFPNADSICTKFEVSRRTAYADRDALTNRLNAPLVYVRSKRGWTYSDRSFALPFLALSDPEARALARSLLTAREYLGPTDAAAVERLVKKLGEHLPFAVPETFESVSGSLHSSADVSVSAHLLDDCDRAIRNRQRIHLLYYSANRDSTGERTVRPYHLHNHLGEWHLIAWCEWRESLRQFYLGRVHHWHLLPTEGAFSIPNDFDAHDYLARGFGTRHGEETVTVRLLFSPWQARWIRERTYHPSQQTQDRADGRLEVTLRVAGTQEILRWILGYGPEVEVLEPESLRREAAECAEKMAEIYSR